jgi:hypothetical protein
MTGKTPYGAGGFAYEMTGRTRSMWRGGTDAHSND